MKFIPLNGGVNTHLGLWAIVDDWRYNELMKYTWVATPASNVKFLGEPAPKYYAAKSGSNGTITMHRLVSNTPNEKVCHHKNGFVRDNRECNLINLTNQEHSLLHHSLPRPFGRIVGETWISPHI